MKGLGKVVGTTVLGATGIASGVLKGFSDTVGFELGSELFGAAKDGSFNGIRNMWDDEGSQNRIDTAERITDGIAEGTRSSMASTARRAAEIAKKNGDMEKYEMYMAKYEEYR